MTLFFCVNGHQDTDGFRSRLADKKILETLACRFVDFISFRDNQYPMCIPNVCIDDHALAEVVDRLGLADDHLVVNLQGDEPLMPPGLLELVAHKLDADAGAGVATLATPILAVEEVFDPNVVKVVRGHDARALYFSRAPIPYVRDLFSLGRPDALPDDTTFLRHLGIYAYRAGTLRTFARLPQAPLERVEKLEQLRLLEAGVGIALEVVAEPPECGVDTPEDLARAEAALIARARRAEELAS